MPETPEAQVTAVHPDFVTVRVDAPVVCPRCAAGRGCGAATAFARGTSRALDIAVPRGNHLQVGDTVRLSLAPARLLQAAWWVYGMPLLGMVGAIAVMTLVLDRGSDPAAVVLALGGLVAGLLLGHRRLRRADCWSKFVPTVLDACERGPGIISEPARSHPSRAEQR
ncbi:MAG: SoxR reducing system RseC family protein [Woeseia sp.]